MSVGGQITTLTPLPHSWVIANYKETQLTHMRVGATASIAVDTFPGHTLHGQVLAFAPGSGAQFALLIAVPASAQKRFPQTALCFPP